MAPLDARDAELVETVAAVVGRLVVAHQRVDHAEIAAEVGRLLNAVVKYTNTLAERPQDEALRRAVARLG